MSPRVLVTGAAGFIGRPCVRRLVAAGVEVHAIVRNSIQARLLSGCITHAADLFEPEARIRLMDQIRPTHLLLLAWVTRPGEMWDSSDNVRWLESSQHLVELFQQAGGERIVVAGSCAEYDWNVGICSETSPLSRESLYSRTKNALHGEIASLSARTGVTYAWGRVFFCYGPGEHPERLISSTAMALLRNQEVSCRNGSVCRDYIYVDDVADVLVRLVNSTVTGPVNIGTGIGTPLAEVVARIGDITGKPDLVRPAAQVDSPGNPLVAAEISRLRTELSWRPAWSLEAGLRETIEAIRRDGVLDEIR